MPSYIRNESVFERAIILAIRKKKFLKLQEKVARHRGMVSPDFL
jgi:hypothetical protein